VEHDSPEFQGRLLRDGGPAADVRVALVTDRDCRAGIRAETRTDALGRFFLERTGHLEPFITAGDRFSTWSLCFEYPDGTRARWSGHRIGEPPPREELQCDLEPRDTSLGTDVPQQWVNPLETQTVAVHTRGCLVVERDRTGSPPGAAF